jgi:hypothetical protein
MGKSVLAGILGRMRDDCCGEKPFEWEKEQVLDSRQLTPPG